MKIAPSFKGELVITSPTSGLRFLVSSKPKPDCLTVVMTSAVYSLLEGGFSPEDYSFDQIDIYITELTLHGTPLWLPSMPETTLNDISQTLDKVRADLCFTFYPKVHAFKNVLDKEYYLIPTLLGSHKTYDPRKFTSRRHRS